MSLEKKIRERIELLEKQRESLSSEMTSILIDEEDREHISLMILDLNSRALELKCILKDNGYEI